MEVKLIPIFLFFFTSSLFVNGILGHQQLLSVLPQQGVVGYGGGQQILLQPQQSSHLLQQLLRQQPYGYNTGGLTQVIGQPGLGQVLTNGAGLGVNQPLVLSGNGVGLTGVSGLPYPYSHSGGLTSVNINGVPVLIQSSALAGLGLNGLGLNGLGLNGLGLNGLPLQTLQQPVISVNPLVRQVAEEEELDPLDAALLDMENQGQMHMEKYAWGRSAPLVGKLPPKATAPDSAMSSEGMKEPRSAEIPTYYNTLPTVSNAPVISAPSTRIRTPSNPFVDGAGKRKKHFELYQYFRNLDLNSPRMLVPVGRISA